MGTSDGSCENKVDSATTGDVHACEDAVGLTLVDLADSRGAPLSAFTGSPSSISVSKSMGASVADPEDSRSGAAASGGVDLRDMGAGVGRTGVPGTDVGVLFFRRIESSKRRRASASSSARARGGGGAGGGGIDGGEGTRAGLGRGAGRGSTTGAGGIVVGGGGGGGAAAGSGGRAVIDTPSSVSSP
jgi:hypothetical protein